MRHLKTSEVRTELGISESRINYLVKANLLAQPAKDASGDRLWTARDVARLRKALAAMKKRKAKRAV